MKLPHQLTCDRCGCPQAEYDVESFSTTCEQCGHEIELPSPEARQARARFSAAVRRVAAGVPRQRLTVNLPVPPLS